MRTVAGGTITQALIDTMTEDNVTPYIRLEFHTTNSTSADDFEWGSDGDPLDDNGGDVTWTISVAGTSVIDVDTSQYYRGTRSARLYNDGTNYPIAYFSYTATTGYSIRVMVRTDGAGQVDIGHGDGAKLAMVYIEADGDVVYYDGSNNDTTYNVADDTWVLIEMTNFDWTAGTYDLWLNNLCIKVGATMATSALYPDQISVELQGATGEAWIDNIEVSEYVDYSSRNEYLEHHEEPYRERAVIGLQNRDGSLDDIDLTGKWIEIAYGYDSSGNSGTTTDCTPTATLWVKAVQKISQRGNRIYQVYCEGMWGRMRNEKVLPEVGTWQASTSYIVGEYISSPITSDSYAGGYWVVKSITTGITGTQEPYWWNWATPFWDGGVEWEYVGDSMPLSKTFNATHTVEEIMQKVVEALGFTWTAVSNSDNLIDVFKPVISIGLFGYESAAAIMYRLIWMTESWLRSKPNQTIEPVFVPDGTTADITFYSDSVPQFDEWSEQIQQLDPNHILVLCNADPETGKFGTWNEVEQTGYKLIIGEAQDDDEIAKYYDIIEPFIDANIRTQLDADNRAEAILYRIGVESGGGRLVLPYHDCRLELFDVAEVVDNRI